MIDPRVASGLRDILPSAMLAREQMTEAVRKTFASFGFLPIQTPHIERMDVLTGKGAGSEEVLRQIFEVTNKGGTAGELALRFDLTVPLARFMAKHVDALGTPFKRYAMGSVFRGERPAKGRFREFVQCDFDTVGTESLVADAETVHVLHESLTAAGVPPFTIALNDRRVLDGLLESLGLEGKTGVVLRFLDKLGKIGGEGVYGELIAEAGAGLPNDAARRVIDFAESGRGGREVLESAGAELKSIGRAAQGLSSLQAILDLLEAAAVPPDRIRIDLGLARGLDYYTGMVFETTVDGWERFGSVASGGRYDNLASLFTTRKLPGVGGSIGLDRLVALLEESDTLPGARLMAPVLVVNFPGVGPATAVRLATRLRTAGIGTEVFPDPIQVGKQMGYGSTRGHGLAVIVGPDEEGREVFNLRNLETRQEQKGIAWSELERTVGAALTGILEMGE